MSTNKRPLLNALALRLVCGAVVLGSLSACAPLVLGSAGVGALMATDRRTSGTQVEDKGIELKAGNRVRETLGDRGHVNVNAYNRLVLLTGEVPEEADRANVEQAVRRVENVTGVVNQLLVGPSSSLGTRSNDVLLAGKVRATLVDARDLISNAFDIVVERGEVYLMGLVTEREARRAAELASSIDGVKKVVRVFDIISEDELANKLPRQPAGAQPAASAPN